MNWIISANPKKYDHAGSFAKYEYIDWKQNRLNYQINDIVYIYCSAPISSIRYKARIEKINMSFNAIRDDEEFWIDKKDYQEAKTGKYIHLVLIDQIDNEKMSLSELKKNGLKAAPQVAKKIDSELLDYINKYFSDNNQNTVFPNEFDEIDNINEGLKSKVFVNKYERSSLARAKCIEYKGVRCAICNMSFEEMYGDIGKDFIHIHHIVPVSEIGEEYKIDYKKDLIPVCPNCHAMLHRKNKDGKCLTIEEMKEIVNRNKK